VQLDVRILTGSDGRLKGQRHLCVDVGGLRSGETRRIRGMHVGRVELGHHHGVGTGRVGDAQPEDAILKSGPRVDGSPPIEGLVPLLVGIAISPIERLFLYFYRPGLYLHPLGVAEALACY
jgi:hypothetical protein